MADTFIWSDLHWTNFYTIERLKSLAKRPIRSLLGLELEQPSEHQSYILINELPLPLIRVFIRISQLCYIIILLLEFDGI